MRTQTTATAPPGFEVFAGTARSRLRTVLVAHYGTEIGADATAEALAYAWQHWPRVGAMDNPVGYLYRVGQSAAQAELRRGRRPICPPCRPP
jgi:RNA polymerase sigma-70 factor (ECF subfamily)